MWLLTSAPLLLLASFALSAGDPLRPDLPVAAPVVTRAMAPMALPRLEAIFGNGSKRSALIDGQLLATGERRGSLVLLSIEPTCAVVKLRGRTERLYLLSDRTRTAFSARK